MMSRLFRHMRVLPFLVLATATVWSADPPAAATSVDIQSTSQICLNPQPPPQKCRYCDILGVWRSMICSFGHSTVVNASLDYTHTGVDYQVFAGGSAGCASCGGAPATPAELPSLQITRHHRPAWVAKGSSFGPAVLGNFDVTMSWYTSGSSQVIVLNDPAMSSEVTCQPSGGGWANTAYNAIAGIAAYDANGAAVTDLLLARTAQVTDYDGTVRSFEQIAASKAFRLVSTADRNGNAITLHYVHAIDADPATYGSDPVNLYRIASIVDPVGRTATCSYTASKIGSRYAISRIDLPNGQAVNYTYANGRLARIDHPDGTVSTFSQSYDAASQLVVYDIWDAASEGTHRRRTVYLTASTYVDSAGVTHSTSPNRVRKVINGAGELGFWTNLAAVTHPYAHGMLLTIYNGGVAMQQNLFNNGRPVSGAYARTWDIATDPLTWSWTDQTTFTSTSTARPATQIDAWGQRITYTSDTPSGDPTSVTYPDGSTTTTSYGVCAQPLRQVDELGRVTLNTYDAAGNRLTRTTAAETAAAVTESWTYNARGQVLTHTDALGRTSAYVYAANGLLLNHIESVDQAGDAPATWTFTYDSAGNRTGVSDPAGRLTTTTLDSRNRPVRVTYADASYTSTTYGSGTDANLVVATTDRNGVQTTFAYDGEGREILRTVAAGTAVAVQRSTTYLAGTDHVASRTERGETTSYTFDYRNRVVATTVRPAAGTALTAQTVYDARGLVERRIDPYGRATAYVYDSRGRVIRTLRELVPGSLPGATQTEAAIAATYGSALTDTSTWTVVDTGGSNGTVTVGTAADGATTYTLQPRTIAYRQPLVGDGSLTVRVDAQTYSTDYPRAGVKLVNGSAYIFVYATAGGLAVSWRQQSDTTAGQLTWLEGSLSLPIWLRMTRTGALVTYATSSDGMAWHDQGGLQFQMGASTVIGLELEDRKRSVT
jgi:YD repeat-containing protein